AAGGAGAAHAAGALPAPRAGAGARGRRSGRRRGRVGEHGARMAASGAADAQRGRVGDARLRARGGGAAAALVLGGPAGRGGGNRRAGEPAGQRVPAAGAADGLGGAAGADGAAVPHVHVSAGRARDPADLAPQRAAAVVHHAGRQRAVAAGARVRAAAGAGAAHPHRLRVVGLQQPSAVAPDAVGVRHARPRAVPRVLLRDHAARRHRAPPEDRGRGRRVCQLRGVVDAAHSRADRARPHPRAGQSERLHQGRAQRDLCRAPGAGAGRVHGLCRHAGRGLVRLRGHRPGCVPAVDRAQRGACRAPAPRARAARDAGGRARAGRTGRGPCGVTRPHGRGPW
ncbi:hypothetical protein H4S02_013406, partial [Coemansia sp. RSA 2611]